MLNNSHTVVTSGEEKADRSRCAPECFAIALSVSFYKNNAQRIMERIIDRRWIDYRHIGN